ncbi:hypothetical protein OG864_00965 [Streptomyces sp. NBC_00124]|uniref:hypothetical protein n=1 Tax=Streptomyces sp. NBC_00124 TaxID=2975662 RepID=UPI00225BEC6E|nr:hypothetical protein [Streptomyces sp. NBC_00124]MCX5357351.1 hypothetical protein [Streptomyces sp. NBC_00124]
MPAALTEALIPSGKLAFCLLTIWRLFPDGLPGMLRAWSHYRTAGMARKLATTAEASERRIGLDILRALYGATGEPDCQTAPNAQERPPDSPADPPP